MDKKIAENPKPPSRKSLAADKRGGNGGNVQYADPAAAPGSKFSASVPGAVARRKLLQQFRKFLNSEQDYWKLIVARLASRLSPTERSGLAPLGIFASNYDDTNTSSQENEQEISEDEKRRRRLEVLPLAHKALIFYGDLARYIEHNGDGPALNSAAPTGGGGSRSRRTGKKNEKTYAKAAGCYRQAIFLMPEDGACLRISRCAVSRASESEPRQRAGSYRCRQFTQPARSPATILARTPRIQLSLLPSSHSAKPFHDRRQEPQHRILENFATLRLWLGTQTSRANGWPRHGSRRSARSIQGGFHGAPRDLFHEEQVSAISVSP